MGLFDQVVKILGSTGSSTASVTNHGSKGAIAVEVLDNLGNQITNFNDSDFLIGNYDSIVVNYTTSSKDVISSVVYMSGSTVVGTITVTYPSDTQEIYTKT